MSVHIPFIEWEQYYLENEIESMPWFYDQLDYDFAVSLSKINLTNPSILDAGTGPATQAIALARKGHKVTGIDVSNTAISKAKLKATREKNPPAFFKQDILTFHAAEKFDLIIDRGCFHVLKPSLRKKYVNSVSNLLTDNGYIFLKTFSHLQPGNDGPYRFSEKNIITLFSDKFTIVDLYDTYFQGNKRPLPRALFALLQKKS